MDKGVQQKRVRDWANLVRNWIIAHFFLSDVLPKIGLLNSSDRLARLTIIGRRVGPLDSAISRHVPGPTALELVHQVRDLG